MFMDEINARSVHLSQQQIRQPPNPSKMPLSQIMTLLWTSLLTRGSLEI